ncbi:MAG: hypothetical protein IIY11_06355 [Clostridia bacterium]|nr:hypothetical protein [Clostridia bacterium]MBQ2326240.1 hypothetical protein [Clostridia bacterium]
MKEKKNGTVGYTIALLFFTFIAFPWIILFFGMLFEEIDNSMTLLFSESPAKPEIRYGEFPFTLVYEIEGKEKVIEDVIVCEYNGIEIDKRQQRKVRVWDGYIKSNSLEYIKLIGLYDELGNEYCRVCFDWWDAEYYMDDRSEHSNVAPNTIANRIIYYRRGDTKWVEKKMSSQEAYEEYGLRIISWECAPKIKNTFK